MHTHTWRYLGVLVLCSAPQTWSALSLNIQYILVIYNTLGYNVVYMVLVQEGWGHSQAFTASSMCRNLTLDQVDTK